MQACMHVYRKSLNKSRSVYSLTNVFNKASIYLRQASNQDWHLFLGHHIYNTIWTPYLCKELILAAEERNLFDRHAAVIVLKTSKIVDHMPNELARDLLKKKQQQCKSSA